MKLRQCLLLVVAAGAAMVPAFSNGGEAATLFRLEAEALPTCVYAPASAMKDAAGARAVVLGSSAARLGAQLRLEPGFYTLVVRVWAPSPTQDVLYLTAAQQRTRLAIGEFERWVVRTHCFQVTRPGEYAVLIEPDPGELGVAIDQVALVRGGTAPAGMAALPKPTATAALKPVAGIAAARSAKAGRQAPKPGTRDFALAALPGKARGRGLDTLFYCSFDTSPRADFARGNGRCGVVAGSSLAEGKWGKALDCTDEKVNLFFSMRRNLVPRAGTLECWVKSGKGNIWADGKDHCLFTLTPCARIPGRPRVPMAVELIKLGADNALHLRLSGAAAADLAVSTARLDPAAWHHVAFSWDFTGDAPSLWLCVDGRGNKVTLPVSPSPLPFVSLQVANTRWYGHYAHANEFKPLGGLLDDLHISDETLARREAGHKPLDTGTLDVATALAAEDALGKWLDKWAALQLGGAWGDWITPRIGAESGVFLDWTGQPRDRRSVSNKYGSSAQLARSFLQAYEHTGDERWRQVALNTAEFYLRGQDPRGYWYQSYVVDESGAVVPTAGTNWARIQDKHQFAPWAYMLYMHRVTGDRRYFEAARKCADLVLSVENPNGSWPGTYDVAKGVGRTTGGRGVDYGCEYNDFATTDPMRMMIAMHHLTGDAKYVRGTHGKGILGIGQWMFDTQVGQGKVRGWCQQYGRDNKPVWSRAFEAPVISPRVVCRFIHPMCLWLYLMTGQERYMTLLQETCAWYRSVEAPGPNGGWYYQYLPDGTPAYSKDYKTVRIDPKNPAPDAPKPSRVKLQLTALQRTLDDFRRLGPEKFRKSFVGSIVLSEADVAGHRKAAAAYCRSQAAAVRKQLKEQRPDGAWVRGRWLRLPNQVAVFRYVLELHVARGVVPEKHLPRGGRDLGYGMPIAWVADWFDVPVRRN